MTAPPATCLLLDGSFENWDLPALLETVQRAEERGLALVVLPDRVAAADGAGAWPDASLLAGWLAAQTRAIGFLVATSTIGHQPYNLARRIASLDMLSGGRMGWLVRNGNEANESAAFSGSTRLPGGNTPDRVAEFVSVVRGLWEGWDADALLFDKESARFLDPAGMHVLGHHGTHFSVQGPLNVMRSPQDRPVLATEDPVPGFDIDLILGEPSLLVADSLDAARRLLADLPPSPLPTATLRGRLGLEHSR